MKTFKKIMHLVPLMLFWLMMTVFFWSWIFTFLTDAPREEKIVLFIECEVPGATHIAAELEKQPSNVIQLAEVKPFLYSMMSSDAIRTSDLYIVSESGLREYSQWFRPLPENALALGEIVSHDGVPMGVKVYDAPSNAGIGIKHISYEEENYYLVFGNQSLHISGNENAVSDEAVLYAARLFEIDE